MTHPLLDRLQRRRVLVTDGGLATELERMGCDLDHPLWSARVLHDDPDLIRAAHCRYLDAGADVIVSSGYQAWVGGLARLFGDDSPSAQSSATDRAVDLYCDSIRIALDARDEFASTHELSAHNRAIVAASIGPYGACLADGSEYRGLYDIGRHGLKEFHRPRVGLTAQTLRESSTDAPLIAFETIPSLTEALVLAELAEADSAASWLSFSCRDDRTTCEGQSITECAAALNEFPHVIAIGVNCTHPKHVAPLVERLHGSTDKPIVVYPNSGEPYDPNGKQWLAPDESPPLLQSASHWVEAGATIIGGCCRTTPDEIAQLVDWRNGVHPQ